MDFEAWEPIFGGGHSAVEREEVRQWCEKGVDVEWAADYFLSSPGVRVDEVDQLIACRPGDGMDELRAIGYFKPSYWAFRLKDGSYSLLKNVLEEEGGSIRVFRVHISVAAKGESLEECLSKGFPGGESEIYKDLLRSGRAKGLYL